MSEQLDNRRNDNIEARPVQVDPLPPSDSPPWIRLTKSRRRAVIPQWVRSRAEILARVQWLALHLVHTVAFHFVRIPLYATKFAVSSPRGLGRLLSRAWRWVFDVEAQSLRAAAIARVDDGQYLKLEADRQAKTRHRLPAAALVAVLVLVVVAIAWSTGAPLLRLLVVGASVGVLGWLGQSTDAPVIGRAVVTAKATRLTSDVVVRALAALGISQITSAVSKGPGITFPAPIARDGPGWRAEVDLPYGVTVADVMERRDKLASGLRRPLGCVWPEPVADEHTGRLVLWVGDQDLSKSSAASWPLLKRGTADIFKPLPFGTDQRGRPIGVNLMFANMIIGAMPRMGKTFALRVLVLAAALDPSVELRLYELKGTGDLGSAAPVAHDYATGADDGTLSRTLDGLAELHTELERRSKTIAGLPREVCPENKVTPELARTRKLGLHPIFAAIDECQELFTHPEYGKEADRLATAIIKRGPAMGIMLILATQRPDAKSLPPGISANAGIRFCLRVMGQVENDMVLGTSAYRNGIRATTFAARDKGIGYLVGASDEPSVVRGYYIDGPSADAVIARARVVREQAGTITGYATGNVDSQSERVGPSLLADVMAVLRDGEPKTWSEVIVDRLAAFRPEYYGPWAEQDPRAKANQLAAALKPYGIDTVQVYGKTDEGKRANRRGVVRDDVRAAVERHRGGTA